jgi:hypothetical protein
MNQFLAYLKVALTSLMLLSVSLPSAQAAKERRIKCNDLLAMYFDQSVGSASIKLERKFPIESQLIDFNGVTASAVDQEQFKILDQALSSIQAVELVNRAIKKAISGTTAKNNHYHVEGDKIILQAGKVTLSIEGGQGIRIVQQPTARVDGNWMNYLPEVTPQFKVVVSNVEWKNTAIGIIFDLLLSLTDKIPVVEGVELSIPKLYGVGNCKYKECSKSEFIVSVLKEYELRLITRPFTVAIYNRKTSIQSLFRELSKGETVTLEDEFGGPVELKPVPKEELEKLGLRGSWLSFKDQHANKEIWWQSGRLYRGPVFDINTGDITGYEDKFDEDDSLFYLLSPDRRGNLKFDPTATLSLNANAWIQKGQILNTASAGRGWSNRGLWQIRLLLSAIKN